MEAREAIDHLYSPPKRPKLIVSAKGGFKRVLTVASSPIVALVIAILAWTIPHAEARTLLSDAILIVAFLASCSLIEYLWRWWKYLRELEKRLHRFRSLVLSNANIDDSIAGDFRYTLAGIGDHEGTVQLVINAPVGCGLRTGSKLLMVQTLTKEIWGTVEVVGLDGTMAKARPTNRTRPEFWENLEDRMRKDPAPPMGFHLEPAVTFAAPTVKIRRRRKKA
jgi:hypothetical protein